MSTETAQPEVITIDDELPALVIPAPHCGHCGKDVEIDGDSAWCERCLIAWDRIEDGVVGKVDPEATDVDCNEHNGTPCEIAPPTRSWSESHGPSTVLREWGACILPSGHEGDHLHPLTRTTTMKRQCGEIGGAETAHRFSAPDLACIREQDHPGQHANGARYWR